MTSRIWDMRISCSAESTYRRRHSAPRVVQFAFFASRQHTTS